MNPKYLLLAPLAVPNADAAEWPAMPEHQRYDASYQLYQEDSDRMQIESYYLRGEMDLTADTFFRFQYLLDSISGASPMGTPAGGIQPFYAQIRDLRRGYMGALAHQFDDHRVELEVSRSIEEDYRSTGLALSDKWDLNQKNTTLAFGLNYLTDDIRVIGSSPETKESFDLFTGVTQVLDKNTVVTANFTLGYASGYLNDQYKVIQRDEVQSIPDGMGGTIDIPVASIYRENRPDQRLREVLQVQGTHYFEGPGGALDAVVRVSHDDYGVFSQCLQLEWRQAVGEKFELTPFVRYYHQNAADFFMNDLNGVFGPTETPPAFPNGSGENYSADYRLSSLQSYSAGLRMRYQISKHFSGNFSYERYCMEGVGSDQAPEAAYPSANIWTIGVSATF